MFFSLRARTGPTRPPQAQVSSPMQSKLRRPRSREPNNARCPAVFFPLGGCVPGMPWGPRPRDATDRQDRDKWPWTNPDPKSNPPVEPLLAEPQTASRLGLVLRCTPRAERPFKPKVSNRWRGRTGARIPNSGPPEFADSAVPRFISPDCALGRAYDGGEKKPTCEAPRSSTLTPCCGRSAAITRNAIGHPSPLDRSIGPPWCIHVSHAKASFDGTIICQPRPAAPD